MATKKAPARNKAGTNKEAAEARKRLFVEAYISNGGNATQAAITAGYSPKTATQQGSRLLTDVEVSAQVSARSQKLAAKYELTTDMVIRSIVQELMFDPARLYDAEGRLLPITELPEDVRMALTSVEFEQHGNKDAPVFVSKVKWAQRQGAREQAMKHIGMFLEDNKQKGGLREMTEDALDRMIAQKAKEAGVTLH
jgi:phage terminase small subunit